MRALVRTKGKILPVTVPQPHYPIIPSLVENQLLLVPSLKKGLEYYTIKKFTRMARHQENHSTFRHDS